MVLPPLLVFDVETNGLSGIPFCVGAVAFDPEGDVRAAFLARAPIHYATVDPYVTAHVLPALTDVPETCTFLALLEKTGQWVRGMHRPGQLVVADCGFPCETRMLHAVLPLDTHPVWAPFPLHELATLLLALGLDPLAQHPELVEPAALERALRQAWVCVGSEDHAKAKPHHPLYDAVYSGLQCRTALARLQTLREASR